MTPRALCGKIAKTINQTARERPNRFLPNHPHGQQDFCIEQVVSSLLGIFYLL
tara:strand:- start:869 stop:1027 length:159 start_codon:yes stop_codon:yes gene_type:complete